MWRESPIKPYISQCMYTNVCVCLLCRFSHVRLFATLWTVTLQAPLSVGILQARTLEWVAMLSSRGSSRSRDQTCISYISCIGRWVLYNWSHPYIPTPKSGTVAPWLTELPTGEDSGKEIGAGRGCAKGTFTFAVFSEFLTWKLMYFLCTF